MELQQIRIDKWLWAARFFKTRSLATQAVEGGKVRCNQLRPKPSKEVRTGDVVEIHIGELTWQVTVLAIGVRRGSAEEAKKLYLESEESMAARTALLANRRQQAEPAAERHGRPTKRDRRQLSRIRF